MELDPHFFKGQLVIDIYEVKLQEGPKHSKKTNFKRMLCQKDFKFNLESFSNKTYLNLV